MKYEEGRNLLSFLSSLFRIGSGNINYINRSSYTCMLNQVVNVPVPTLFRTKYE